MDYYKILEVSKEATEADIKKAYRRLSKKYHPDANPGDKTAEKRFMEISEAYGVLGDKEKRQAYDRERTKGQGQAAREAGTGKKTKAAGNPFDMRKKNSANPIDTTDLFEKYMGFKAGRR